MSLSESERDELRQSSQAALGPRGATLFMSTLHDPDDEPASRRDVSDSAQVLSGEIESVRREVAEMRGEMSEMGSGITSLTHEVRNMGVRVEAEFVAVRGEMAAQGGRLLAQIWLSSFTAAATAGALVLAAVTLG